MAGEDFTGKKQRTNLGILFVSIYVYFARKVFGCNWQLSFLCRNKDESHFASEHLAMFQQFSYIFSLGVCVITVLLTLIQALNLVSFYEQARYTLNLVLRLCCPTYPEVVVRHQLLKLCIKKIHMKGN